MKTQTKQHWAEFPVCKCEAMNTLTDRMCFLNVKGFLHTV